MLKIKLEGEGFIVFSISFEALSEQCYESEERLLYSLVQCINFEIECDNVKNLSIANKKILSNLEDDNKIQKSIDVFAYSRAVARMCKSDKIVLLIDEVDQAGNHIEFIKFLGLLRGSYMKRDVCPTFQSVILVGVYDVKNLKLKIRTEDQHQYNSPWNIAVAYEADMSLSALGISKMLAEYKSEHELTFDEELVGQMIYDYTSGYPFLVSRMCQIIDQENYSWKKEGVLKAVNHLLTERNTLFDDMIKKMDDYPDLKDTLKHILYVGTRYAYNPDEKYVQIAMMFNFIKVVDGALCLSCRLMETRLYNYFHLYG